MFDHYTNGTGNALDLSDKMDSIISASGLAFPPCEKGDDWNKAESLTTAFKSPWAGGLGTATLNYTASCDDGCLTWEVSLTDIYDFDPKPWGTRTVPNEIKTRLVDAASKLGCGWKNYNVTGNNEGKSGTCCE